MLDIVGDSFEMGANTRHRCVTPLHTVSVHTLQRAQSEVTVSQYITCVDRGDCSESNRRKHGCNWNVDVRNVYEWIEDNYV